MSRSPVWKIYTEKATGILSEYVGSAKYPEYAAMLVACMGKGATVKLHHDVIVWIEGEEEFSASESYDRAAEMMVARGHRGMRLREQRRVEQVAIKLSTRVATSQQEQQSFDE